MVRCWSFSFAENHSYTFTVNSYCPLGILREFQKLAHDRVTWCAAVDEEEIKVVETSVGKTPGIVYLLVQADNGRDIVFSEVREVGFWSV